MFPSASIILKQITVWDTDESIDVILPLGPTASVADQSQQSESAVPILDESNALTLAIRAATQSRSYNEQESVVVDCSGYILAPGLCDPHVHFRDPGQTQKESMLSGCSAAASGGYTNVLIMPNTVPALDGRKLNRSIDGAQEVMDAGFDSVVDYLQHYAQFSGQQLPVHYDLCVAASKGREGNSASQLQDWQPYVRHASSRNSSEQFNNHPIVAISDDGSAITDGILEEVAKNAQRAGIPIVDHCEHHDSGVINEGAISRQLHVPGIPSLTELTIVKRDIALARRTQQHVHLQHVSTAAAFEAIRQAKHEGLPVSCETAPHYIALCDEDVLEHGTLAKMNPPLRSATDRQATIEAVCDGTVDMLATDHAPHTITDKQLSLLEAPNGIIGLESAYGVCHSILVDGGYIDNRRLIELMSVSPARLMGEPSVNIGEFLSDASPADLSSSTTPLEAANTHNSGTHNSAIPSRRVLDLRIPRAGRNIDLSILAPNDRWTIEPERFYSHARNTPFASWSVTGLPVATILSASFAFSRVPSTRISLHRPNIIGSES